MSSHRIRACFGGISAGALLLAACSNSGTLVSDAGPAVHDASLDAGPPTDSGVGADANADASVSYDFTALQNYLFKSGLTTDGVVVTVGGRIVYEAYANGFTASMRHLTYSVSKTIGSALIGIAVDKGLLALGDSVCKYVSQLPLEDGGPVDAGPGPPASLCAVTIADLLHMTSGLQWSEDYGADPTTSNVLQMLYGNQTDMGGYAAEQPSMFEAGTVWNYSSGDANIVGLVLKNALAGQDARAWAKANLFDPAGLSSAFCETDRSGTIIFSSWCFFTPRDMATFGQLYLNDGMSGSTRVLPAGWVAYSITPAGPVSQPTLYVPDAGPLNSGGSYGADLWLNAATPDASPDTFLFPEAPADSFLADGHWGQVIMMVPSRQLVIARVGNDFNTGFDPGPMAAAAVAAVDAARDGGK